MGRQMQRLVARYRDGGGVALIHKSRGRTASNKLNSDVRELVLELVRQSYRDFGPTSEHRWFEDRGEPCTLLVFIHDATSSLMQLRFVPSEKPSSYFEALRSYLQTHSPVAFYSDKHSVFRVNRSDTKNDCGMTQLGRAIEANQRRTGK